MSEEERLVAIVSPWDNLSKLIKNKFRVESLASEKKVMVWREDLQDKQALGDELKKLGFNSAVLATKKVTTRWQDRA